MKSFYKDLKTCYLIFVDGPKKKNVDLDTRSEWIKSVGDVLKRRIRRPVHSVNTCNDFIFLKKPMSEGLEFRLQEPRRGGVEVAGWTVDRKTRVRFPAYPHRVWALWWQGG